jgi:hypothetical protein
MSFAVRRAQPELFPVVSPLTGRFGVDFFRQLPVSPGVYFFHGAEERLLYIGQSNCLRKRLGSYRFVSEQRHPRRTLRLLQRVERITWQLCLTPAEAVALEAELLLAHRPPFNRAGVWQSPPWWLRVAESSGKFQLQLAVEPGGEGVWQGPLPGSFRYVFATLVRTAFALTTGRFYPWELPAGMNRPVLPLDHGWPASDGSRLLVAAVSGLASAGSVELLLNARAELERRSAGPLTNLFWEEQWEAVERWAVKRAKGLAGPG